MEKLQKVEKLIEKGRYEEAETAFASLVDDSQLRSSALGPRAWFFLNQGRYDEAVADYEALIQTCPEDLHAKALLAQAHFRMGKLEEAMKAVVGVLQENPLDPNALETLRQCQEAHGVKPASQVKRDINPLEQLDPPPTEINHVVAAIEADPKSYPASVSPTVGRVLYSLVRLLRPELMIETGSFIGYSASCIGQALEDNKLGVMHAFDLHDDTEEVISPAVGKCKNRRDACSKHIEALGLSHRVIFHQGDSSNNIAKVFKDREPCVDMAFIDGDHTLKGCPKDWWAVDAVLKDGGVVVLHDTIPEKCAWVGPRKLLEELEKQSKGNYQCLNLPTPEGCGLGIVQKAPGAVSPHWQPSLVELLAEKFHYRKSFGG